MKQRILVAVVGVPALLGVLCFAPDWATMALIMALCIIGSHELLADVPLGFFKHPIGLQFCHGSPLSFGAALGRRSRYLRPRRERRRKWAACRSCWRLPSGGLAQCLGHRAFGSDADEFGHPGSHGIQSRAERVADLRRTS